jgi:hypothetical protein
MARGMLPAPLRSARGTARQRSGRQTVIAASAGLPAPRASMSPREIGIANSFVVESQGTAAQGEVDLPVWRFVLQCNSRLSGGTEASYRHDSSIRQAAPR